MARTQEQLSSTVDDAETRRRAFLARLGSPQSGGMLDQGSVLSQTSPMPPPPTPSGSVLDRTAPPGDDSRLSVLQRNEMSPLSESDQRETAGQRAMRLARERNTGEGEEGRLRGGTPGQYQPNLQQVPAAYRGIAAGAQTAGDIAGGIAGAGRDILRGLGFGLSPEETRNRSLQDIVGGATVALPVGQMAGAAGRGIAQLAARTGIGRAVGGLAGGAIGGAGRTMGGVADDLGGAIRARIGVSPAVKNAISLGDDYASQVGRSQGPAGANSFRMVGGGSTTASTDLGAAVRARATRMADLEGKEAAGVLTPAERQALDIARGRAFAAERPFTPKPVTVPDPTVSLPSMGTLAKMVGTGGVVGAGAGLALASGGKDQGADQGGQDESQTIQPGAQKLPTQTPQGADNGITPPGTPGTTTIPGVGGTTGPGPYRPPLPPVVPPRTPGPVVGPPRTPPPPPQPPRLPITPPLRLPTKEPGLPNPPEGGDTSGDIRRKINDDLNGISDILGGGSRAPDVQALFVAQGSKLLQLIDEQEKTLRAQAESEGKTIDPATQATIDALRSQLDTQLKSTRETLNSRGLFDSGILIEAEQMLRRGTLSEQGKLLSERLTRIQQNLSSGLASLRGQRVSTASQFGMAGAQAQTQAEMAERNRMDTLRQQLVQGRLGLAGQVSDQEQAGAQRDFSAQQSELERQSAFARLNAELAARSGDAEAQRQWQERQNALDRDAEALRTQYTQGATSARQNPPQPTSATIDLATNQVIAQLSGFGSRAAAEQEISGAQGQPGFENVDWYRVIQSLDDIYKQPQGGIFRWPWE